MNIALWVVQGLLAAAFGMAGFMKATQPREKLLERVDWVEDFPQNIVKLIGALEFLGAVGLILPMLTDILPWLTPLAATGLALDMLAAILVHIRRNEAKVIPVNLVLGGLAVFVAVGRFFIETA